MADIIQSIAPALAKVVGDDVPSVAATLALAREAGICNVTEPGNTLQTTRALSRFCASAGWLLADHAEALRLLDGFPAAVRDTVRKTVGDGLIVSARTTGARLTDAGLHGVWPAVGGLAHADWLLLTGIADAAGQQMMALVAARDVPAVSYAYLGGLRGVGWQRLELAAFAVMPGHIAPAVGARGLGASSRIGCLIGCAEGGYDDYVRMTRSRMTGIGGAAVAGFTQVQARLAESDAELGCATRLFEALARTPAGDDSARAHRDRAYMARLALDAVTRLVRQMGAMGLSETNPVQRRYRDLRLLAADPAFAWDGQMAAYGRELLGIGGEVAAA